MVNYFILMIPYDDEVMERIQFAIDEIAKECNVLLVRPAKKEEISNNMIDDKT